MFTLRCCPLFPASLSQAGVEGGSENSWLYRAFRHSADGSGPIVIQAAVPVRPDDTEETLGARVLQQEHRIYPEAVRWFVEDRLRLSDNFVDISKAGSDGSVLYSPGLSQ